MPFVVPTTALELGRSASEDGTGHGLPASCYRDPEFFDLEVERVLRPGWHAVARWDDLPEPGDYRTVDLFGERVLVLRDEKRKLRAFSGICLHRAYPFASGEGNAKRFVCPYHRWSYDLEGRLRAAPLMEGVPGFDRSACRLPEFPLEEWQGFVFVSTNRGAAPLAAQLGALDELLAPLELGSFVHAGVLDWDSPWNWKLMVENFIESYHHLGPHAESLAKTNPAKGTHALDVEGPCVVLENPSVEGADPFWVVQVFPTFLLAQVRGEFPLSSWFEMQIDRHDHFHLRIHLLLPEALAATPDVVAGAKEVLTRIHLEDIPMCEGIQKGMQSLSWKPGRLSRQEENLRRFHRYLSDALATPG